MKTLQLWSVCFWVCSTIYAENRLLPITPPAGYTGLTFSDLSADGKTALGVINGGSSNRVVTWNADAVAFSILRGIADTEVHGASALSGDGATVLGYSPDPADGNNSRPWIYRGGTLTQLSAPGPYERPSARELSFDGAVVAGMVDVDLAANVFAFRPAYWTTPSGGSQSFSLLSSESEFQVQGWLDEVDPTGRYLFGDYLVYAAPASYDHYRYDRLTGSLVLLTNVHNVSLEEATADGSVMVYKTYQNRLEQWNDDQSKQIFEYTPSVGFTGFRYVYGGMTADASMVFGVEESFSAFGGGTTGRRLVYWDADRNLHDFTELFAGTSVDTNGWNFGLVSGRIDGVSTNGLRMVGRAQYNGQLANFYLEFDPNDAGPPPVFSVDNLVADQREGAKLVDLYYDLSSDDTNVAEVTVSIYDGFSPIGATNFTGDVGASVVTGAMKHIIWDGAADWNGNLAELKYFVNVVGGTNNAIAAAVPKTGQTTSYQSGDDGDLQMGIEWPDPRFAVTENGTVFDNLTGLEWVQDPSLLAGNSAPGIWTNALDYCANLAYAGGGWRLPSYKEIFSLIDYGNGAPALPAGNPFAGIHLSYSYWTGSTSPWDSANSALVANMYYGNISTGQKAAAAALIWPVRGNPSSAPTLVPQTGQSISYYDHDDAALLAGNAWPAPRFADSGNGTVIDYLTGLEWINDPHAVAGNGSVMDWSNAVSFCEGLDYASNQDWRLPNIKELESIVSIATNSPAGWLNGPDTPFTGILEGNLWTSTALFGSPDSARYVNTYIFSVGFFSKPSALSVWPVRTASVQGGISANAHTDTRNYSLTVASPYGSPLPALGTHSNYCWRSTVTASLDTAVSVGESNLTFVGWLGTGSVPVLGSTTNTGEFVLNDVTSSIEWRWIVDADSDQMPDDWELLYYGSSTGAVATADTDGDGYNAWQEYILGSNPTNSGSSFLFTPSPAQPTNSAFSVDFTTVAGRLYTVECTDDLASGNWQVLTNFIGDGSAAQLIDPASIPNCFYHVRIDWVE